MASVERGGVLLAGYVIHLSRSIKQVYTECIVINAIVTQFWATIHCCKPGVSLCDSVMAKVLIVCVQSRLVNLMGQEKILDFLWAFNPLQSFPTLS